MDVLVLMSGGIDSTACAHFFQQREDTVRGVFVDYGQLAAKAERRATTEITTFLGIPLSTLSFRTNIEYSEGEVVGRNAFLVFATLMGIQPRRELFPWAFIRVHPTTIAVPASLSKLAI